MSAPQHRLPLVSDPGLSPASSIGSAGEGDALGSRFAGAFSRGVTRCRSLDTCDPRVRLAFLFAATIAATALCIATPWLPYSPWNKPLSRYGLVEEPVPMNSTIVVPRIIHQTWKDENIPEEWQYAREQCQKLHPGYQFMLWTDESARKLIEEDYPEWLAMYDRYGHNIQRADAMRLFFLHKHGGVYIDLDIECTRSVDFLRHYPWVMPQTKPVGFSNDFMVAAPKHPFLQQMMDALPRWNKRFGTKYPTVMFSTGPMFVSYQAAHYRNKKELFVLPECLYGKYVRCADSLFKHYVGSTWHSDDAAVMKGVFRHRVQIGSVGLLVLAAVASAGLARAWRARSEQMAAQAKGH